MTQLIVCGWRGCQRTDVHQHYEPVDLDPNTGTGGSSERDLELASDACYSGKYASVADRVVELIANAREEGRKKERDRCVKIALRYAGDSGEKYGSSDAAFNISVEIGIMVAKSIARKIENG